MAKLLAIEPDGWPCEFRELPPGLFLQGDTLGLRTEYGADAFVVESGEAFAGGTSTLEELAHLIVQPCRAVWKQVPT